MATPNGEIGKVTSVHGKTGHARSRGSGVSDRPGLAQAAEEPSRTKTRAEIGSTGTDPFDDVWYRFATGVLKFAVI